MYRDDYTIEKLVNGKWEIIISTDDYDYALEQLEFYDMIYENNDDVVCIVLKRHIHF